MKSLKFILAGAVTLLVILIVVSNTVETTGPSSAKRSSAADDGQLKIGVLNSAPVYYTQGSTAKGFDYEVALEVAESLGIKPSIVPMDFADLFTALDEGKIDMIASQVSVTEEREKVYDFSHPYFVTYLSFTTPKNSPIKKLKDVNGTRVAIVDGTAQESVLETRFPKAQIVKRKNEAAALEAVAAGKADSFFYDAPFAPGVIKNSPMMEERIRFPSDKAPIAFVFRKGDGLRDQANKAIDEMIVNGTWLRIKTDYFKEYPLSELFREQGVE
ncbi:substrate-binding periplasmic protein [Nocardioides albus]|uniref:ABC-type amino acid transport substrate-binding protein n=1 Tax=Nocardioides albus TaxID=1841 RepID=A0A7W5A2X8_9ACTN|nr:transporter substrate-binding domain-containing protein [Nocardioides albus]MBB3088738.1 ABC-type amino acid transport substrate-binding protein [Nocardioides albus]GGU18285.1 putative histidine-binding protein [Nocardioides albus]